MPPLLLYGGYDENESTLAYYAEVLSAIGAPAIEVQLDVDGKGKGLASTRDIRQGESVFVERPQVSIQHTDNQGSALVCQQCLRFIGSVERQIGHKLCCLVDKLRGTQRDDVPGGGASESDDAYDGDVDLDGALEAGERLEQIYSLVTPERISELRSETVKLPLSAGFQLPQPVPCRRGCGALYCGAACEAEAWEHCHCLLCTASVPAVAAETGTSADEGAAVDLGDTAAPGCSRPPAGSGDGVAAEAGPSDAGEPAPPPAEELYGIHVDRRAVAAFGEHARSTNEIFLLAAQVVAATLLRAARLLAVPPQQHQERQLPPADPTSAAGSAGAAAAGSATLDDTQRRALLAAWRPYAYGWKRCWWDSVAVPEDVDDEEEFRGQLRSLAADSLELLSGAISDPRFGPELLQLEVYGSIVGMFELNNLGLTVSSPVEDYFLAVDAMEEGQEKQAVTQVTQPLLDALDAEYATPCEATAFMTLQSCINHSCDPNCTAACDAGDRTVTVLAQRDIAAGEEISLSYIDVSLPYKQRQAELRDYGFVCRCARCLADAAAARAKRQGGGKGLKVGRRR